MLSEYNDFLQILKEELVPAMGCTEPIALAYGASIVKDLLDGEPCEKIVAKCSGNIIKNVKCVKVPNTGGMVGIEAAVLAGLIGGRSELKMEVISRLNDDDRAELQKAVEAHLCAVELLDSPIPLHVVLEATSANHSILVETTYKHTHIERIVADGKVINLEGSSYIGVTPTDRSILSVRKIIEFANTVILDDVAELLNRQIDCNMAIAEEGVRGGYGINIASIIDQSNPGDLRTKMIAYTAAASEARMEGCPLPVVTNSGSGNQGITSSVPVIVYCREKGISKEQMLRALVLSNLLTVHQKTGIGALSAFCGAVCAAISSGAAITYLKGGSLAAIDETITNSYGGVAGMVCDGAKATCGFKIYAALSTAFLSSDMAMHNLHYCGGTGIIKEDIEDSIRTIGRMAKEGMAETDKKILELMLDE